MRIDLRYIKRCRYCGMGMDDEDPEYPGACDNCAAHAHETAELSRLRAENERMREALTKITQEPCDHGPGFCARELARAALEGRE